jgi:hypothetical protein
MRSRVVKFAYHAFCRGCHNWREAAVAARLAPAGQRLADGAASDQATSGSNAAQVPSRPAMIATALT